MQFPFPKSALDLAAMLALRARGHAEPNPIVGAVIVSGGQIIARGHHRRFGGLHAETEALAECRARGIDPRGSTMYVTLEPCNHHGKQPPCTKAIIEAGIGRVVIARQDPHSIAAGGAEVLRRAGIEVEFTDASQLAIRISDPFVKRVTTGLPWVIAKWAQTPDGRLITRPDELRWISNEFSRRRVHKLRARVDAVITGIGTVLADDPLLTARRVHVRRIAKRVVLDSGLRIPDGCALIRSARDGPVLVCTSTAAASQHPSRVQALKSEGVDVVAFDGPSGQVPIQPILKHLADQGAANVLLESGPRLLKSFIDAGMVDELVVYVGSAPEEHAASQLPGFDLSRARRLGNDLELHFWRSSSDHGRVRSPGVSAP